jgi:L-alanine-DL-glutamate epimerase-like enolase superfamily enzyme
VVVWRHGRHRRFAISALDMALWDLKGKILGQPLYQLLGGKQHQRLPVCASTHPKASEIDAMAAELAGHIANGYPTCQSRLRQKRTCQPGREASRDIAFVAVREAIGPDAGFIVDIGAKMYWDIPHAIQMARAFAEHNLTWLEDVFHPDNIEALMSICARPCQRCGSASASASGIATITSACWKPASAMSS